MWIVIEKFDREWPVIVGAYGTDTPAMFDTEEEAQKEADECQDGQVVKLT